jgi:hypothetical protein
MAYDGSCPHSQVVHNGPTRQDARCCGVPPHVVTLTQGDVDRSLVQLVRCTACGLSTWRLDSVEVARTEALAALSRVYAAAGPRPAPTRVRVTAGRAQPAVVAPPELAELLAGWQVLGAH